MGKYAHRFAETYRGLLGLGFDRQTDEHTVMVYLQRFTDDRLLATLVKRMDDQELAGVFDCIGRLLKKHLSHAEYHRLFLGDDDS